MFHADRGAQYTSRQFAAYCERAGARLSMGRTGVCWDNAAAESFFATLKNEMYHRYRFTTRARARFAVAEYIEVFYNRTRLHSSLGYKTQPPSSPSTRHQRPQPDNQKSCPTSLTQPSHAGKTATVFRTGDHVVIFIEDQLARDLTIDHTCRYQPQDR